MGNLLKLYNETKADNTTTKDKAHVVVNDDYIDPEINLLLESFKTDIKKYRSQEDENLVVYTTPAHEEALLNKQTLDILSTMGIEDAEHIPSQWNNVRTFTQPGSSQALSELIKESNSMDSVHSTPNLLIRNISKNCHKYYDIYSKFNLFNSLKAKASTAFTELDLHFQVDSIKDPKIRKTLQRNIKYRIDAIFKLSGFDSIYDFITIAFQQYIFLGATFIHYDKKYKIVQLIDQNNLYIGSVMGNYIQPIIKKLFYKPINFELSAELYNSGQYAHLRTDRSMEWGLPNTMINTAMYNTRGNTNVYYVLDMKNILMLRNEPLRRHNLNFESPMHNLIDELLAYNNIINTRRSTRNNSFSDINIVSINDSAQYVKGIMIPSMGAKILERGNVITNSVADVMKQTGVGARQTIVAQGVEAVHTLHKNFEMRKLLNAEISDIENTILSCIGIQAASIDPNVSSGNPNNQGKGEVGRQEVQTNRFIYSFIKIIFPIFSTIVADIILGSKSLKLGNDIETTYPISYIPDYQTFIDDVTLRFKAGKPLNTVDEAKFINNTISLYLAGIITLQEAREDLNLTNMDIADPEWQNGNKLLWESLETAKIADKFVTVPEGQKKKTQGADGESKSTEQSANTNGTNTGGRPSDK